MIKHRHTLAGQVDTQGLGVSGTGDQDGLIIGIGARKDELRVPRFKPVGRPQEIDRALLERLNHFITGVIAAHFNADVERLGKQLGIVGGDAFQFIVIVGQFERPVIGRGNPHPQRAALTQPVPVSVPQHHGRAILVEAGMPQQPQGVGLIKGRSEQRQQAHQHQHDQPSDLGKDHVDSDQMITLGKLGHVHHRRHPQLLLEPGLVGADGLVAQQHICSNFVVGKAQRQHPQHCQLAV